MPASSNLPDIAIRYLRRVMVVIAGSLAILAVVSMMTPNVQQSVTSSHVAIAGGLQDEYSNTVPNPVPTDHASLTPSDTPLPSLTSTPTGSVTGTPTPCSVRLEDVPPSHPDYDAIRYMTCSGAMESFRCGQSGEPCVPPDNYPYFRPNNLLGRAEVMKYLVLAEGFPIDTTGGPHFTDVPTTNPF